MICEKNNRYRFKENSIELIAFIKDTCVFKKI